MRRFRALLCACAWTSLPTLNLGWASIAQAQTAAGAAAVPGKEHAKRLFEEGAELEKKADYASALAKYEAAEQITVTPGLRFHKGYCLEMTGKLALALDEYDLADKLARDQNKQDVRTAITARLESLRTRVPHLAVRLSTPPQGVEVFIDGVVVAAPLLAGKGFRLDPGEHTLVARAAGYRNLTRRVQAPESVTTTVDVSLERATPVAAPAPVVPATDSYSKASVPAASPPPAPSPSAGTPGTPGSPGSLATSDPPEESPHRRSRALPIATTAGTVVLAGAGVAFFVLAGGAQQDGERDCITKATCVDEQSRVRTFDALALGSFIGAAGLGVVSIVLWASKGSEHAALGSPPRSRARAMLAPGTIGLEATF